MAGCRAIGKQHEDRYECRSRPEERPAEDVEWEVRTDDDPRRGDRTRVQDRGNHENRAQGMASRERRERKQHDHHGKRGSSRRMTGWEAEPALPAERGGRRPWPPDDVLEHDLADTGQRWSQDANDCQAEAAPPPPREDREHHGADRHCSRRPDNADGVEQAIGPVLCRRRDRVGDVALDGRALR